MTHLDPVPWLEHRCIRTRGSPDESRIGLPGEKNQRMPERYSKYPVTSRTKSVEPEDIPQKTES